MVMGTSSGIEPIFAPGYIRRYYDSDNKSNDRILKEKLLLTRCLSNYTKTVRI